METQAKHWGSTKEKHGKRKETQWKHKENIGETLGNIQGKQVETHGEHSGKHSRETHGKH